MSTSEPFKVITMCGSTRFKKEYLEWSEKLIYGGAVVIVCPIFFHADNVKLDMSKIGLLRDIQKQKIRMCDEIFVVNKDGYIGKSTKEEIEYAKGLGKKVVFMEPEEENR